MTTRAKELADALRICAQMETATPQSRAEASEIAALLDRLAAIDSAAPEEVREIAERLAGVRALPWASQAERYLSDIATLLAIVQRQAGEIADMLRRPAESRALRAETERDIARAEVERLTERLHKMQHGEAEALKMMAAEKQRADVLAEGVRLHRRSAAKWVLTYLDTQQWEHKHGHLIGGGK